MKKSAPKKLAQKKPSAYDPSKIESKWQKKWAVSKIYKSKEAKKEKFYVLDMFPYPSGEGLHVGHPKGYIATDVVSRMNRMQGKNVLHPMGFDAFGLPAENYAIKTKTNPADSVKKNVARYKKQLEILGFDYDWSREVNTTDPKFYKWTQWIFLQLLKKGLAYESNEPVNWCPTDKTVLANEDVENGRCERCGTPVEKKPMRQWVLKITDYADRLLNDLDGGLLDWPESIKESQRNWIGRSEGAEINFRLVANRKPRFVLIHGFKGSAHTNFFLWLKRELEARGHEVEAPELPNSNNPTEAEQVDYVIKNCTFDDRTVVVGHSLGSVVALKALMKMNKKVSGLVLVAAATDPSFSKDAKKRIYHNSFRWDIDYDLIQRVTDGKIAVLSDTREPKRAPYLKYLSEQLKSALIITTSVEEHFTAHEEPAILECVTPNLPVFTTRPDTIFGVTYLVLAPEHPWVNGLKATIENWAEVEAYIAKVARETEIERTDASREKSGVELKGVHAVNPATNQEVPVWIADYVLADYGTGAVMAVPAHDERDFVFAKKFNLPVKYVVEPKFVEHKGDAAVKPDQEFVKRNAVCAIVHNPKDNTYLCTSWKKFKMNGIVTGGIENGEDVVESARREVVEETGYKNLKHVKTSPITINTLFYHRVKQQNRHAHFQFVFFDLENEERGTVSEEDAKLHDIVWKKSEELAAFFTVFEGQFLIDLLNRGDFAITDYGILTNSGSFTGKESKDVMREITEFAGGKWVTKYKLRDWVFSRQRYWGEPIPVIHCKDCGVVAVPEKDLPVKLPRVKSYEPTGTGESPLAAIKSWVNVKCPKCKGPAKRETNTMPQWAGSSWYYLRYMDPKNTKKLVDLKKEKYWSPVDLYVGGAEHATRHLIYARFWHKFLNDIGAVSTSEPFKKLQNVGLIMGADGQKMSKRFGNVVNPDDIVKAYGADTLRIYEMFMGPFDQSIPWSTESIVGSRRFIERVWKLKEKVSNKTTYDSSVKVIHKTIKKVTDDIQALHFNTAISTLMIAVNELEKSAVLARDHFETLLKLLAPFAPHVSEELWTSLGNKKSIHLSKWPTYDAALAADNEANIIVQVNGRMRGSFKTSYNSTREQLEKAAQEVSEVKKWLEGKVIAKIIVVPNRLVNIVLTGE